MTADDEGTQENKSEVYRPQATCHLDNAQGFLARQEFTKASEFLWGAVAQAVKAVAVSNGIHLAHHGQVWDYVKEISRTSGKPIRCTSTLLQGRQQQPLAPPKH